MSNSSCGHHISGPPNNGSSRTLLAAPVKTGYRCRNQIDLREANLNKDTFARRDVLKLTAAAGALGLPTAFRPGAAHAAGAPAYNPAAQFDLAVSEVEFRRN